MSGGVKKAFLAFDGEDFCPHFVEDGGLIAAAGTYFEDFHTRLNVEELALHGHCRGLRDGLGAEYGEGSVFVSEIVKSLVEKPMAWDDKHGLKDAFVGNAFGAEGVAHFLAQAFVFVCVDFVHGSEEWEDLYGGGSVFPTLCTELDC